MDIQTTSPAPAGMVAYPGGMSRTFRNSLLNAARGASLADQNAFLDWVGAIVLHEGMPLRGSASACLLWDEYRALDHAQIAVR